MGLWGYFGSANPSATALIPVFAGIVMLSLTKWVMEENKIVAHIVVSLTFIMLIALFKPLLGSISRNDQAAVIRILAMMFTCSLAMVFYIKSFIDARRQRRNLV